LAGLDAKVKSIIKETVKSQFIKKEAISFDSSLLECDLTNTGHGQFSSSQPSQPLSSSKRSRLPETIDLSSPGYARNTKRQDFRNESGKVLQPGSQSKGFYISTSYNLQGGFYKSLVFYIVFQILENILKGWSSLTQGRLLTARLILQHTSKSKTSKSIKPVELRKLLAHQLIPKEALCPRQTREIW